MDRTQHRARFAIALACWSACAAERSPAAMLADLTVASVADLPPCNNGRSGEVRFVASDATLYACVSSSWRAIPGGPPGPQGPRGPAGLQGPSGTKGADGLAGSQGPKGEMGLQGPAGPQGATGHDGHNALLATASEPAGENCAQGGIRIESGTDLDDDGTLDTMEMTGASPSEITRTCFLCADNEGVAGHCSDGDVSGNCNDVSDDDDIANMPVLGATPAPGASIVHVASGMLPPDSTWTNSSTYILDGDVTVPVGHTLTIQPGTLIRAAASDSQATGTDPLRVEFVVRGTLNVTGTSDAPVWFTAEAPNPASWAGLKLEPGSNASFAFSVVENATLGLDVAAGSPALRVATFRNNTIGVQARGAGSVLADFSSTGNGTGLTISSGATVSVVNAIINGNAMSGIDVAQTSTAAVVNTTIANNQRGITSRGETSLLNSIVAFHSGAGLSASSAGSVTASHSLLFANAADMGAVTLGTGMLSADPKFATSNDLRLQASSPAIDAGTNAGAPTQDFLGVPRPLSGTGLSCAVDLGAFEFLR